MVQGSMAPLCPANAATSLIGIAKVCYKRCIPPVRLILNYTYHHIPYVTKCSRSIIFANFANGAHSRILLFANFMLHIHGIYICVCTIYYNIDTMITTTVMSH